MPTAPNNPSNNDSLHLNPSRQKIPYPLLKKDHQKSNPNTSCPQINKLRQNRSLANITNITELFGHKCSYEALLQLAQNMKEGDLSRGDDKQFASLLDQNKSLMQQLSEKQTELVEEEATLQEIQQKYIRLLEVINERSEQKISILLGENNHNCSRTSRSKHRVLDATDQALKLKAKLDNLDISCINAKENPSIGLSEVNI